MKLDIEGIARKETWQRILIADAMDGSSRSVANDYFAADQIAF
jgi:hypothetical protein